MFTDRKRFLWRFPGTSMETVTWVVGSGRRAALMPSHPKSMNVFAGLTPYGLTGLHIVAGTTGKASRHTTLSGERSKNVTQAEYGDVLASTLLPEGERLFKRHARNWVMQQDNDPAHAKAGVAIAAYNALHNTQVQLLPNWPPNSPDLSLIETVWAYLDKRMAAAGCTTFAAFQDRLHQEAAALPEQYIANLFRSMPRRIRECIKCEGGKLRY